MSDGLPFDLFDYVEISGTTNVVANTQMVTMPVNRFGNSHVRVVGLVGEAVYLENGSVSRSEIDIRSRVGSAPFKCYLIQCNVSKIQTISA